MAKDIRIKFNHLKDSKRHPLGTTCSIKYGRKMGLGSSILSEKDNFNKEVGRKIALKRAINNMPLEKEDRTNIWSNYHKRKF